MSESTFGGSGPFRNPLSWNCCEWQVWINACHPYLHGQKGQGVKEPK
jgi:hypothetical protein